MPPKESETWVDAAAMAHEALELAKRIEARQKALAQVTMLMLATLGSSASKDHVEQLLAQLERIRDLTGPAGVAAGEVIATAVAALERVAKR